MRGSTVFLLVLLSLGAALVAWRVWPTTPPEWVSLRSSFDALRRAPVPALVVVPFEPRQARAEVDSDGYRYTLPRPDGDLVIEGRRLPVQPDPLGQASLTVRGVPAQWSTGTVTWRENGARYTLSGPEAASVQDGEGATRRLIGLDAAQRQQFGYAVDTPLLFGVYLPLLVFFLGIVGLRMGRAAKRSHIPVAMLAVAVLALAGCSPTRAAVAPELPAAPETDSPDRTWEYAIDLLRVGQGESARAAFERTLSLGADRWPPADSALFLRDLAEVRLAAGDTAGAREAVQGARTRLGRIAPTAQFQEPDRQLYARLLDALEAAARGDTATLDGYARDGRLPTVDPAYLLGWVREQAGDRSGAVQAYRAYLDGVPRFGILRRTAVMRLHAADVVRGA